MNARDQQVPRPARDAHYAGRDGNQAGGQDAGAGKVPPPDLVSTAKNLLIAALSHVRTRLELLGVELAIEKTRMISIAVVGMLSGFFAVMTFVLGAMYVIAAYWDTPYRLIAIGSMLGVFFAATLISGGYCYYRMRVPSVLFSASAAELGKDTQAIDPQTPQSMEQQG